mmetsp:Transcript_1061/g.869  ORF Transcript_1061/g.869 Transcript_1061/m.869 type:complete len:123 (+) Transcript_1061:116-484(+)|eukprot:CAMPEP_0201591720 /NCGR_PEP_ID=MMETSP0190_2-20130828/189814_1 /ASSEMBLY_ACC=CAM_ASM_000263 /TAXON_ID=37353 /ORGANISM="Rosalina sp." /LENGTH=122 /DNA_ID=CAMNT_0048050167 /DNA_START=70 /DNA_END=438 /DNA_ORIENTATION=+
MTTSQLACTYAALALFDDDLDVNAENIQKLLKAANVKVETYWPGLFQNLVKERGVAELIAGACKGGGGAAAGGDGTGGGGGGGDAGAKEEEKKEEEEEEESSSKSGPGLFGDDSSSDDDSSD